MNAAATPSVRGTLSFADSINLQLGYFDATGRRATFARLEALLRDIDIVALVSAVADMLTRMDALAVHHRLDDEQFIRGNDVIERLDD